ncbi:Serpin-Z3 [Bienertia sinuspersici]
MKNFGLKVANYILQKNVITSNNNVVCSPLSMNTVLNIIALGSTGQTLKQLQKLTGCKDVHGFNVMAAKLAGVVKKSKDVLEISSVNSVWVDQRYSLNDSFQKVMRDLHRAQVRSVNFVNKVDEVVKEVNLWAQKESRGLIKEIISKSFIEQQFTMLLLVNALYFKGTWVDKFNPKHTQDGNFHLLNGGIIRVPFLDKTNTCYMYGTFEGCQVLKMPYKDERQSSHGKKPRTFSMYIILPKQKDGLSILLDKLHNLDYSNMFKKLQFERIRNILIPKFDFECDFSLEEHMKHLGLTLPFHEDCKDLTRIVALPTGENLYVSKIIQKCRVVLDENGTEAVAFTRFVGTIGQASRLSLSHINFVADHPFMFMIREDVSGVILFVGIMLNPSQS